MQPHDDNPQSENPAADLIRARVEAAYNSAPPARAEEQMVAGLGASVPLSRHQRFIEELMASGKSLREVQAAWLEYYAGLTDGEKHQVWQEFYSAHDQASSFTNTDKSAGAIEANAHLAKPKEPTRPKKRAKRVIEEMRKKTAANAAAKPVAPPRPKPKHASPLRSLLFGLSIGAIVILIFMFSFFNERFIAPFIQPSRNITNTPIISDNTAVGTAPEIIIPKINVEIPVVYGVDTINSDAVESALEDGVVHYADTALPGQDGNLVIVGHSSNNIFNQGKYKFAFVLLSRLDSGDTFYLQKDGVRYTYQVYQKEIVSPTDVSVLGPKDKPATATLITCDPPGTSTNRLVVTGEQISPSPSANVAASTTNALATKAAIIPGNSPTLWSRLVKAVGLSSF